MYLWGLQEQNYFLKNINECFNKPYDEAILAVNGLGNVILH
jgi:hypothetical protein